MHLCSEMSWSVFVVGGAALTHTHVLALLFEGSDSEA